MTDLSKRSMLKIACRITFGSSQGDFGVARPNIRRESVIETFQCADQAESLPATISIVVSLRLSDVLPLSSAVSSHDPK